MKQNIIFVRDSIHSLDNNINLSLRVLHEPELKANMIGEMVRASVLIERGYFNAHSISQIEDVTKQNELESRAREVFHYINNSKWDHHCWGLHDCHFHTDFMQFVSCPFTCLYEIDECLSKIIKENYNA